MYTSLEKYALAVAKKYHNDPIGLILFLNKNIELSKEKQIIAYQEITQILNFWINDYRKNDNSSSNSLKKPINDDF